MTDSERDQIEAAVCGLLCEGVTVLDILTGELGLKACTACFHKHRSYAITRLDWYEHKRTTGDDCYSLPAWKTMTDIANAAFADGLRHKAINELIDVYGVVPVTYGNWCVPVRDNAHDNFRSAGAIISTDTGGGLAHTLYSATYIGGGFTQMPVVLWPDWDKASYCCFRTTVRKKLSRAKQSQQTPVPAMLMIAVRACFKSADCC